MEDFFRLDEQLSTEEKLMTASVNAFVDQTVIPEINNAFEQGCFPESFKQGLIDLGVFGLNLPVASGGSGVSALGYGLVCQALERGDSGLRSFASVQNALGIFPINQFGSAEQRQNYLPKLISGEMISCFGLTEPNAGSDPANMQTTAKKTQAGWVINGAKLWITNATIADIAIVWAKTDEGVRGFVVPMDTPGVSTHEIKHKMSLRASITGEISFNQCEISEEQLLPETQKGLSCALKCLTQARYGIAWGAVGAAIACFDTALAYTQTREQFGKPLAQHQLVQKSLVEMFTAIQKAQLMNYRLAQLKEEGQATYTMISMAKMNACQTALEVARSARNCLGANGISLEYHVIRHMNNLESVYTYEGADNIHHLIVGRYLTGLDAFS